MTPDKLASYLRVILIYGIAVGAAAGAAYELFKTSDLNNPIVVFAIAYLSTILGFHIGVATPAGAAASAPPAAPATPATDPAAAAAAQAIANAGGTAA